MALREVTNRWVSLALPLTPVAICLAFALITSTAATGLSFSSSPQSTSQSTAPVAKPAPAPARWRGLIGEYGPDDDTLIVLEKDGRLGIFFKRTKEFEALTETDRNTFKFPVAGPHAQQRLIFARDKNGRATQ